MLQTKMASLLKAYKSACDNERLTGAAPCVAPYGQSATPVDGPIFDNDKAGSPPIFSKASSSSSQAGSPPILSSASTYRRKKSAKEIIFEKKIEWEREKQARKEHIVRDVEAARQKRHGETQAKLQQILSSINSEST